jgi:hypothetical protein
VADTHPVLLQFGLAYAKVKVTVAADADYKDYNRTTFGLYFRPEWLWWAQIPFGKSGSHSWSNSGLKNLKLEYDRLLLIA